MSVKKKVTVQAEPIEPYVEIERTGRLEHKVTLHDPTGNRLSWSWGDEHWFVYGARRAERLAERKLRRHLRLRGYTLEPTVRITAGRIEA